MIRWEETVKPWVLEAENGMSERDVLRVLNMPPPLDPSRPHALEISLAPVKAQWGRRW